MVRAWITQISTWVPTRDRDQPTHTQVLSLRRAKYGGAACCIVQIMQRQSYIPSTGMADLGSGGPPPLPPGLVESDRPHQTNGHVKTSSTRSQHSSPSIYQSLASYKCVYNGQTVRRLTNTPQHTVHRPPSLGGDNIAPFNGRTLNYHLSQQHVVIISVRWLLAVTV